MKVILVFGLLVLALSFTRTASADGTVPTCWDSDSVVPGSYLISVETDRISKEALVDILGKASSARTLKAERYPLVLATAGSAHIVIEVNAQIRPATLGSPATADFRRQVAQELSFFVSQAGVRIMCNNIARLSSSISTRN